jgi:hypothetical protein
LKKSKVDTIQQIKKTKKQKNKTKKPR